MCRTINLAVQIFKFRHYDVTIVKFCFRFCCCDVTDDKIAYASKFLIIFINLCERPLKTEKNAFYHLLISVFIREISAFEVTEILRENAKKKIEHLVPL